MKLTTIGILLFIMQAGATSVAQQITLHAKDISYEKFFKSIEKQTGYSFLYDPAAVSVGIVYHSTKINWQAAR